MSNETQQKPIFKKQLRYGIASAVFESQRDGRIYRSVNLQRSYRKNDEWHRMTIYLDHEQIPFMICLLYTSPSPRDLSTSRMPSSA